MAKAGDVIHHQIEDITIGLPVAKPGKILCLGLNYMDHIAEGPFDKQPFPAIFHAQLPRRLSRPISQSLPRLFPKRLIMKPNWQ
jgi:2-keto-4-pentenoate hydratase/2-oxohepta-3-ene-1,7-dioic acid hydratase in catechol pathway